MRCIFLRVDTPSDCSLDESRTLSALSPLREIPVCTTVIYSKIAERIGMPKAVRAAPLSTSSPVNFVRRPYGAHLNSRFSQRNTAVGGNKGGTQGNPGLVQQRSLKCSHVSGALGTLASLLHPDSLSVHNRCLLDILLDT
jgi:hypothetical protein